MKKTIASKRGRKPSGKVTKVNKNKQVYNSRPYQPPKPSFNPHRGKLPDPPMDLAKMQLPFALEEVVDSSPIPTPVDIATLAKYVVIDVFSHHITVRTNNPAFRKAIGEYTRKWLRFSFYKDPRTGNGVYTYIGTYASATRDRSEVRYHINQYPSFLEHMKLWVGPNVLMIKHHPYTRINDLSPIVLKAGWAPRDEQPEVIEYALKDDYPIKMLTIQTGQGKSATSLFINQRKSERFCLVTKPGYLEKWVGDITKMYDIPKNDIILVAGPNGNTILKQLIKVAKEGKLNEISVRAILLSNRLLYSFIQDYEENPTLAKEKWGCVPDELWSLFKIDTLYIDEGHQDSRIMFKIYTYTHIEKMVCMSATFDPDDPFLKRVTEVMYPNAQRYKPKMKNQHTLAYRVSYKFHRPGMIYCTSRGQYSHLNFEKSIMRNKITESNYYNMIATLLEGNYMDSRQSGYKAIIFCHTVKMCSRLKEYLEKRFNQSGLKFAKYTAEDPYDNLINSDVIITTIKSAGTAIDIPGLYVGIMTVALRSSQTNIQVLGRLRRMADGTNPKFLWLSNSDNIKHKTYDSEKYGTIRDRVKSIGEFTYMERI